jgi:drug/metabolite transporter (DMT)-like permease
MPNIFIIFYALTTSLALIFMKIGTQSSAPIAFIDHKLSFNLNFFIIAGVLLYGISFLVYTYLISKYDLGYIIPVATAIVYVLIFVASFVLFKETFTMIKILGIVLILAGLTLVNIHKG